MELQSFLKNTFASVPFAEQKKQLQSSPFHLDVRERDDLYLLMVTSDTPVTPVTNHCVGVILDKVSNTIVSYAFPRTTEVVIDTFAELDDRVSNSSLLAENLMDCHITHYFEGVKMTLYHHDGSWKLATNRMIDAQYAFWSSDKSFKQQFMDVLKNFPRLYEEVLSDNRPESDATDTGPSDGYVLEPDIAYTFLLCNTESQTYASPQFAPKLYLLGCFERSTLKHVSRSIDIPSTPEVNFSQMSALTDELAQSNCFRNSTVPTTHGLYSYGFMIQGRLRYKLLNSDYVYVKSLRGNHSDPIMHYLDIRKNSQYTKEFLDYYPNYVKMAQDVEHRIFSISERFYRLYIDYHITRRDRPFLTKTVFVTLQQIHSNYVQSGIKRNLYNVHQQISLLPSLILYRLLKCAAWNQSQIADDVSE